MHHRWFWLLNGLLILLYVWALGEETTVSVQVINGRCLAAVPERYIGIDCPEMGAGSRVGFYAAQPATTVTMLATYPPLRWLAPHTAWAQLNLFSFEGQPVWRQSLSRLEWAEWQTVSGDWQARWGELHGTTSQNGIVISRPVLADFILTASLRRAEDEAGLLLLAPDSDTGLVFVVDGLARRGVWWRWENGRPTSPLSGIPFQKPFWQQARALVRLLLTGHQAALLLLAAAWLQNRLSGQTSANKAPKFGRKAALARRFQSSRSQFSSSKAAVAGLTLLTFALTLFIASDVLARVPHVQDSLTYLFQAQTMARGDLWVPASPLPSFFEQEFLLVQNGRWFGKYSPGYPAVLALGVLLKAPWLINPLLATLTVPLLYQLGRRLYGDHIGMLGAGLMTLSPFFLFLAGSHMAHAAELFWLTLFMVAWLKAIKPGAQKRGWALLAGLAAGMAFLTRQLTAVAIVGPFFLLTTWRSPLAWRSRRQKVVVWLAGLLPLVALLFVYQWAVTGSPGQDPRLLYWPYDRLGFGDDVGEATNLLEIIPLAEDPGYAVLWRTDPGQPPRGHTPQRGLHNILRNWQVLQADLFGWVPLFTFSFLWLGFLLKRPSPTDWILLLTLGTLVAAEAFYWHSGIMYGPRYFYGGLPALVLLTARGVQVLARRLGRWPATAALTLLLLGNIFNALPEYAARYRGFNFVTGDKVARVETTVPDSERALVFVESPTGNWWEYGELFLGNTPWLDGRLIFARDLGAANGLLQEIYPNRLPFRLIGNELQRLDLED